MRNLKKIAIFFGGYSTEYEVSLQSAYAVIEGMDTTRYEPILIGIDRYTGAWFWYQGKNERIKEDSWQSEQSCISVFPSLDQKIHGLCYLEKDRLQTISLDAALPILHGKNGEDGTVQGVLKLMGVPVIGCGLLSSALCMDKELAHCIVRMNGIKTARSATIQEGYLEESVKKAALELGYPLFVKPVRSGSSFGITKVAKEQELFLAVEKAFEHDSTVLLEEMIEGFEVGCAILGKEELLLGAVDEIELSDGFFDYTEKYTLQTSKIHVPARISPEKAEEIKRAALTIYRVLGCSHFARVDLFLTPMGEIYFNEVNTIPGFTSHSRYPNMLKEAGLSFEEIIHRLLEMEG
ncbi:MAG: D-alanine--D-serine ligase VanG [Lachnospiraceae bacterium]|jgi:D-alanine---D-serine ligase|nr:D-alanine--D-serine ligase VanG [Lachnospiraceae bacterium]